jgi:D-glycero-D-manno-heptose 1,7-bisphosphate phosphatase
MRKAVFLDRDGVLNRVVFDCNTDMRPKYRSPDNLTEFSLIDGVREQCKRLRGAGFDLFVVTNQPDKVREHLLSINRFVKDELGLTAIVACTDRDDPGYKPGNATIEYLLQRYNVDRSRSFMVGDRWKDVEAGRRSRLVTIQVEYELIDPSDAKITDVVPDYRAIDMKHCADIILAADRIRDIDAERYHGVR